MINATDYIKQPSTQLADKERNQLFKLHERVQEVLTTAGAKFEGVMLEVPSAKISVTTMRAMCLWLALENYDTSTEQLNSELAAARGQLEVIGWRLFIKPSLDAYKQAGGFESLLPPAIG